MNLIDFLKVKVKKRQSRNSSPAAFDWWAQTFAILSHGHLLAGWLLWVSDHSVLKFWVMSMWAYRLPVIHIFLKWLEMAVFYMNMEFHIRNKLWVEVMELNFQCLTHKKSNNYFWVSKLLRVIYYTMWVTKK